MLDQTQFQVNPSPKKERDRNQKFPGISNFEKMEPVGTLKKQRIVKTKDLKS